MPYYGNPAFSHKRYIPPLPTTPGPLYTSAESYWKQLVAKVVIKPLSKKEIYYYFDPFTYGNNPGFITYCSLSLGTNQHGQFEIEFEDADKTIDDTLVRAPARCYIYFGKSQSNFNLILSGMIRQSGYTRGCENNLLYNISGFGTGVRTNERILDANEVPTKLEADNQTIDTSDSEFKANTVVDDTFDDAGYYPQNITSGVTEGTGGYGYINSSGTSVNSPIKDFIPGVVARFQEMADVHNQVEDYTGARVYIDTDDVIQIQPLLTPLSSKHGFMITTNQQPSTDLADNTMYIQEDYSFTESIQKDAGYSNGIYGILQADPVPDVNSSGASLFYENKTVEIAQRFRPPTNPNWRIFCGVEAVGMSNTNGEGAVRGRWRICEDDNGKPRNTDGIVANKYMPPNKFYNTGDGGLQVIQVMGLGNTDLDENKWYWLILSSVNSTATEYWRWYYNTGNGQVMTASTGTSSDTNGGTGWTGTTGKIMEFTTMRFKAEPFGIFDQKAIDERIIIESVAQSFPQQITSKLAANKYIVGLAQYAARPRRVFQFPAVTVPDRPVLPGDIAYIVDSRFNFSTSGNPVVTGTITDLQYSFGSKGAGTSSDSKGMTNLSLNVVGYNQNY